MRKFTLWKMILALVVIIGLPVLFFQLIGDNPFLEKPNTTNTIAIVNEDAGVEVAGEQTYLGGDVSSILTNNSPFEWTVVSRSAGENGLRNQKYDAVIYVPSNFSEQIMAYEEENPSKVTFNYNVQSQLNAVNTEKVNLEIEKATKRANERISSLYWNYVADDMEMVRSEFEEILQKELDFQQTMLAFYKPSSKNLADQILDQEAVLKSMKSSIDQIGIHNDSQNQSMKSFAEDLTSLVDFIKTYEEYQQQQKQKLTEMQTVAISTVNAATEAVSPYFEEQSLSLSENNKQLTSNVNSLYDQLGTSKQLLTDLKDNRLIALEEQTKAIYEYQSRVLDYYQQLIDTGSLDSFQEKIIQTKERLTEGEGSLLPEAPPENPEFPDLPIVDEESDATEKVTVTGITHSGAISTIVKEENKEIQTTSTKEQVEQIEKLLNKLQEFLKADKQIPFESREQLELQIADIQIKVQEVKQSLQTNDGDNKHIIELLNDKIISLLTDNETLGNTIKELTNNKESLSEENRLLKEYMKSLTEVNDQLREQLTMLTDNMNSILTRIEEKEQVILESSALSEQRKSVLQEWFNREFLTGDMMDLLYYYAYLDQYETILTNMLSENKAKNEVMKNEQFLTELAQIFQLTEAETNSWIDMESKLPTVEDGLTTLQDQFVVFLAKARESLDSHQTKLAQSLTEVKTEGEALLQQIKQGEQTMVQETGSTRGAQLATVHLGILEQMATIHSSLKEAGEHQQTVIDQTNELHQEVSNVQTDADTLNNKWATNVNSTKLIKDDVFNVLQNTFIEGQSNGDVYNFLSSPLQLTAGASETKQEKSIPPVVVLFIVLISSLLIGYTTYYFNSIPLWVRGTMFTLLNLIVGFIISLFGIDIYELSQTSTIQWTIFTILLLLVSSSIIAVSFAAQKLIGLFITVGMIILYVTPLLALTTPNFTFNDPMSKVYMSIQYGTQSLFTPAAIILLVGFIILIAVEILIERWNRRDIKDDSNNASI